MNYYKIATATLILFSGIRGFGQQVQKSNVADIILSLEKLTTLGSVLYIAAHPDDENTRLISYLANEKKVRTAYLSITRGGGGQNLIGTEKGAAMGVLRTQELIEARKVDGGEQFFTRAVDFGYSKSPEETMEKWNKEKVLGDIVWIIRKFRPDVIITRFPPQSTGGHGHHSASSKLALEAFGLASSERAYPEQLNLLSAWKPKRLMHNASSWWDKDIADKAKNSDDYVVVDVGTYNPILGRSYNEIASISRSKHRSQGFGSYLARGSQLEYLRHIVGEKSKGEIFDGIDITWNRIAGATEISVLLMNARQNFDPAAPNKSIPLLLEAREQMKKLGSHPMVERKIRETEELILACGGIWIEALASKPVVSIMDKINVSVQIYSRLAENIVVKKVSVNEADTVVNSKVNGNKLFEFLLTAQTPSSHSNPYWLNGESNGTYQISKQELVGKPENDAQMNARIELEINGIPVVISRPVVYKWRDRAIGELYRPLVVAPPATLNMLDNVYLFSGKEEQEVEVAIKAHRDITDAVIYLEVPRDWTAKGTVSNITMKVGEEKVFTFTVIPEPRNPTGDIIPNIKYGSASYNQSYREISYDHIQTQTMLTKSVARAMYLPLEIRGSKIAYIMGAGDDVPATIEQIGFSVDLIEPSNLLLTDFGQYDAVITGARAYNTVDELKSAQPLLMEYVKNGGTMLVQYNTSRGLKTDQLGPFPLKLSRDRVTVEEAEARILLPDHPVFNIPNKIVPLDFEGWVQERGLYFPGEWDEKYQALISWNDPGEDSKNGSLLVAEYGSGVFIYTGISFFRQLPAGVPGAIKLFANLISQRSTSQEKSK